MQIVAIQILRALAALSVSIGHAQSFIGTPMENRGETFGWNYLLPWNAGVDLFFVISGFIITWVHYDKLGRPAALGEYAAGNPGVAPDGFIFHVSRCGSTVIARSLKIAGSSPGRTR